MLNKSKSSNISKRINALLTSDRNSYLLSNLFLNHFESSLYIKLYYLNKGFTIQFNDVAGLEVKEPDNWLEEEITEIVCEKIKFKTESFFSFTIYGKSGEVVQVLSRSIVLKDVKTDEYL